MANITSKSADLLQRAAVTVGILLLVRFAMWLPLPGFDPDRFASAIQVGPYQLGLYSEPSTLRFSLIALGITPIISTWLITAPFTRWLGPASLDRFRLAAAALFAAVQGYAVAVAYEDLGALSEGLVPRLTVMATLTAGTFLLVWLGAMITRFGLGDGLWIIAATESTWSVLGVGPTLWGLMQTGQISMARVLAMAVCFVGLIAFVVGLELARRRTESVRGRLMDRSSWIGAGPTLLVPLSYAAFLSASLAPGWASAPVEIGTLLIMTGLLAALTDVTLYGVRGREPAIALFAVGAVLVSALLFAVVYGIAAHTAQGTARVLSLWGSSILILAYAAASIAAPLVAPATRSKKIDLAAAKVR